MDELASQLLERLERLGRPRVLVLGDLILDRYTWGDVPRVSPEAPVLILAADCEEARPGGAASVCGLLRGLEAQVTVAGVLGQDQAGQELIGLLQQLGVATEGLIQDPQRTTTQKQRFIGRAANRHPHQILRVDREQTDPLDPATLHAVRQRLQQLIPEHDVLLISDYAKGVCDEATLRIAIEAARRQQLPIAVDPARRDDYRLYQGADVVTPNRDEAQRVSGLRIGDVQAARIAGRQICQRDGLAAVVVTLDREGMVLAGPDRDSHFPTRPRTVYDITGAGDMVLATIGLCLADRLPLDVAVPLANVTAGLEVERVGVVPIHRDELRAELEGPHGGSKVISRQQAGRLAENARRQGKRVVFTNGCFDLLHVGHVKYLQEAAALGDHLIVGLNGDESIRRLKGPTRPVIPAHERSALLAALHCVDSIVIFDEDTPHELLEAIRPDVLVKGGTYTPDEVVGKEIVQAYGGKVCVTPLSLDVSTTKILDRIRQQ